MQIHKMAQGTPEWLAIRAGRATASEVGTLVVHSRKKGEVWTPSEGKGVDTYLSKKLAEWWLGRPLEFTGKTSAMDRGTVLEDDALPKFELETGLTLERVGFITTDDGLFGFSPDSMVVGQIEGVECKAPLPQTHVKYLIGGCLPDEYFAQVQSSMYGTGAAHWWFESYCPGFPELILKVPRDDEYISVLAVALQRFNTRMEEGKAKLIKLNGGIEPVRAAITEEEANGILTATMEGVDAGSLDAFFSSDSYRHMGTP